ncbi:hypothetical protein L6164_008474 [Bauhinia variegata]|uniref:Uncharacterized protein n=1 Tax=Bauhinia variegata TaxID=167791 RepID=A0ACB9PGL0_BAUVA|nr:hypothetical protein L6164_008474 [Bauhinia variegata]
MDFKFCHKMIPEIQGIRISVNEIKDRSGRHGFKFNSPVREWKNCTLSGMWNDPEMASLFLEEAEFVGIEFARSQLVDWLTTGSSKDFVISVLGIGGLGKTALSKKVYDDHAMIDHCDCLAWIPVSRSYNMLDILGTIIKQFSNARKEAKPDLRDSIQ